MKILTETKVCDGYDVMVLTDQGETVMWHWSEKPKDVDTACAEIQKDLTARIKAGEDGLEDEKMRLEEEKAHYVNSISRIDDRLSVVTAAIAAKQAPK